MRGKSPVHWRARGIRIDLHEQLSDHLSVQALAHGGQVTSRIRGATLASEPDLGTELGDIVVQRIHVDPLCPRPYVGPSESKGVGPTSFAGIERRSYPR